MGTHADLYALVMEAKNGKPEAMDRLLVAVRPLLEKTLSAYADPRYAAQSTSDLIQEAWLRTWLKLEQFSSAEGGELAGAKFLAWVEKVVKSVGLNAVRDRKALKRAPSRPLVRIDGELRGDRSEAASKGPVARTPPASARLHEEDRTRLLREAIEGLEDAVDRVILRNRLFEGLTLKRIAERLELEYAEVKARYRSGIQRIEQSLRGHL